MVKADLIKRSSENASVIREAVFLALREGFGSNSKETRVILAPDATKRT